jgi:hypothetical protein
VNPDKEHEYETEDDDIDQSVAGGSTWDIERGEEE